MRIFGLRYDEMYNKRELFELRLTRSKNISKGVLG